MTLMLEQGTVPKGLPIKTFCLGSDTIFLGDYRISMADFCAAAQYVLTNTNLQEEDPRREFVKYVRELVEVPGYDGWGPKAKRLARQASEVAPMSASATSSQDRPKKRSNGNAKPSSRRTARAR